MAGVVDVQGRVLPVVDLRLRFDRPTRPISPADHFVIDHFELFGLKQVVLYAMGRRLETPRFKVSFLYRHVRHPLMLGFLVGLFTITHETMMQVVRPREPGARVRWSKTDHPHAINDEEDAWP